MSSDPCPKCDQVHDPEKCTGHNARGLPCGNKPIRGGRVCSTHGGSAPQVRGAAERRLLERQAVLAVETFGLPREVDPHTALLEELHRTAGAVQWLGAVVAGLDREAVAGGSGSAWVEVWQGERDRLLKVAKACVDVGIEERRVRLAEQDGAQLASVVRAVLDRLGLSAEQQSLALRVVPEEFRRLGDGVVPGEVVA